jgi:hypothetical protein
VLVVGRRSEILQGSALGFCGDDVGRGFLYLERMMGSGERLSTLAAIGLLGTALLTTACGGGSDDDDNDNSSRWQCYSVAFDDTCECYEIEPGSSFDYEGSGIEEVEDCGGYEVCMSYFDSFFEENRCDCGPVGFMPGLGFGEDDIVDLTVVEACPLP